MYVHNYVCVSIIMYVCVCSANLNPNPSNLKPNVHSFIPITPVRAWSCIGGGLVLEVVLYWRWSQCIYVNHQCIFNGQVSFECRGLIIQVPLYNNARLCEHYLVCK